MHITLQLLLAVLLLLQISIQGRQLVHDSLKLSLLPAKGAHDHLGWHIEAQMIVVQQCWTLLYYSVLEALTS